MTAPANHPSSRDARRHDATEQPSGQSQPDADRDEAAKWPWVSTPAAKLAQAVIFGLAFGFLLQKGGVAKFDILVGVLILEDFTVVKVMLSAIITGMVGVYVLQRLGFVELQIKSATYGANIVGGLLFGVGFGLLAYCPGTDAAAVGQGNYDALVGVAGMLLGSYLFALVPRALTGPVSAWGQRGKLTVPELLGVSRGLFVAVAAPAMVGVLVLIQIFLTWQ